MEKNVDLLVVMIRIACLTKDVFEERVGQFAVPTVNVVKNSFAKTECVRWGVALIILVLKISHVSISNVRTLVQFLVNVAHAQSVTSTITEYSAAVQKI